MANSRITYSSCVYYYDFPEGRGSLLISIGWDCLLIDPTNSSILCFLVLFSSTGVTVMSNTKDNLAYHLKFPFKKIDPHPDSSLFPRRSWPLQSNILQPYECNWFSRCRNSPFLTPKISPPPQVCRF